MVGRPPSVFVLLSQDVSDRFCLLFLIDPFEIMGQDDILSCHRRIRFHDPDPVTVRVLNAEEIPLGLTDGLGDLGFELACNGS